MYLDIRIWYTVPVFRMNRQTVLNIVWQLISIVRYLTLSVWSESLSVKCSRSLWYLILNSYLHHILVISVIADNSNVRCCSKPGETLITLTNWKEKSFMIENKRYSKKENAKLDDKSSIAWWILIYFCFHGCIYIFSLIYLCTFHFRVIGSFVAGVDWVTP